MASYRGLKQAGDGLLDYMMRHRPEVPDEDELLSQGLHDLEELFPGIYKEGAKKFRTSGETVTREAMDAINAARGNPDAEVDIFRAVPQGVRDFNVGDWVTTSKSYAHKHGGHALNGDYDIITGKAKASDLYNPGDSIAEMGYWGLPMAGKVTRGLIPAVGAGGLLALMGPEEAEAAPAAKGLANKYAKAAETGAPRRFEGGTIYDEQLEKLKKRDKTIKNNRFIANTHGADAREATGEMTNEEAGEYVTRILDDMQAKVLPNFPSKQIRDAKSMLYGDYRGDKELAERFGRAKDVVMPVKGGRDGDVVMNTIFEPTKDHKKYIDDLLGRPSSSPMSGLRSDPASAQPQGLSVVSKSSMDSTIPSSSSSRKAIIPLAAGGVLMPATATGYQFPADKRGTVLYEPGLESPIVDPADILTAPFGVAGLIPKAAHMAAEPFLSYGMDKVINGLFDLFSDEED